MAAKKARTNPEANPHLFLKLLRLQIIDCKQKIAIGMLWSIIGHIRDAELKRVARKASNHFVDKKAGRAERERFQSKCLKNLRAMATKERKNGLPRAENVCD